jgi:hypothetical protein
MLLRRFSNHIRRQDWFAVLLDLLVVVLGIVIGLQASQWNQSRIDQREEIKYLVALAADLDESHALLKGSIDNYDRIREALIRLIEISDDPAQQLPGDNLDQLLWQGLWDLSFVEEHMNVYDDLKSSGRMNLIGDPKLRLGLTELKSMWDRYGKSERDAWQIQNLIIDGYLNDHFNIRRFALYSDNGEGFPQAPAHSPPPDSRAFLSAQPTRNRVTAKYIASNTAKQELVKVEAKLVEVQQLLRERMQRVEREE